MTEAQLLEIITAQPHITQSVLLDRCQLSLTKARSLLMRLYSQQLIAIDMTLHDAEPHYRRRDVEAPLHLQTTLTPDERDRALANPEWEAEYLRLCANHGVEVGDRYLKVCLYPSPYSGQKQSRKRAEVQR